MNQSSRDVAMCDVEGCAKVASQIELVCLCLNVVSTLIPKPMLY
jgi:hypothetical protein